MYKTTMSLLAHSTGIPVGLSLLFILIGKPLSGQSVEHDRPWRLGPGVSVYGLANASGEGIGPSLIISRRFDEHFDVELIPTLILRANGIRTFVGIAGDLGIAASWPLPYSEFIMSTGLSALTGVDGSGGQLARGGAYLGGQANLWFTRHLGVYGRLNTRLWLIGHISEEEYGRQGPSASGGLIFRF